MQFSGWAGSHCKSSPAVNSDWKLKGLETVSSCFVFKYTRTCLLYNEWEIFNTALSWKFLIHCTVSKCVYLKTKPSQQSLTRKYIAQLLQSNHFSNAVGSRMITNLKQARGQRWCVLLPVCWRVCSAWKNESDLHSSTSDEKELEEGSPLSHSPVPELSFLLAPYRGWTRAGERRVQDNLHAHAQNEPIKNY